MGLPMEEPAAAMGFPLAKPAAGMGLSVGVSICGGAWVLAAIHKMIAGFQRDEVYIGTAEERAARGKGDHDTQLGAGHMKKLPGFAETAPASLKKLFEQDPEVRAYISSLHKAEEGTDNESA